MSYDALIVNQIAQSYGLLGCAVGTLSRVTLGPIDPGTGEPTSTTPLSCTTRFKLDATGLKTLGFKFGDGLVQGGDIQGTIPAKGLGFFPQPGDTFTAKTVPYIVVDVRPGYAPGGAETEFSMLLRK